MVLLQDVTRLRVFSFKWPVWLWMLRGFHPQIGLAFAQQTTGWVFWQEGLQRFDLASSTFYILYINCLVTPDFIGFTSSDLVISPWFVGTIDLVQFGCCVASQCVVTSGEIMACTFSWVQATVLAATDFLNQMTPSTGIFARCPVSSVSIPLSLSLRALKVPCDTTSHLSRYLLLDAIIYVIYMYHCITFKVKAFPTMFFKTRAWREWPNSDVRTPYQSSQGLHMHWTKTCILSVYPA